MLEILPNRVYQGWYTIYQGKLPLGSSTSYQAMQNRLQEILKMRLGNAFRAITVLYPHWKSKIQ